MARYADVAYIADMNPGYVAAMGEDLLRAADTIKSVSPQVFGMRGTVTWSADAADLYEQRLVESADLLDELYDGYQKAGSALTGYAAAQSEAQQRVSDGRRSEVQLGELIAPLWTGLPELFETFRDPISRWADLRSLDIGFGDFAEIFQQGQINDVREEADRLYFSAIEAYDDATRIESTARETAVTELNRAYDLLPDLRADSELRSQILQATPWLAPPDDEHPYRIGPPTAPELTFDDGFPFDPDARPTPGDYASYAEWQLKLRASRIFRSDLDDANDAYQHYLDATGTDLRVDFEEGYREDDAIRRAVDQELARAQSEAERLIRETGQTSFQMTGDVSYANFNTGLYPETENWQKTLGAYAMYGTADVVVVGDQVTMTLTVHAEDKYNFNPGAADIATGTPDSENGRFAELGWAKEFRTYGEVQRTVTWTLGDADSVVTTDSSDTTRGAPSEDRADGRDDG